MKKRILCILLSTAFIFNGCSSVKSEPVVKEEKPTEVESVVEEKKVVEESSIPIVEEPNVESSVEEIQIPEKTTNIKDGWDNNITIKANGIRFTIPDYWLIYDFEDKDDLDEHITHNYYVDGNDGASLMIIETPYIAKDSYDWIDKKEDIIRNITQGHIGPVKTVPINIGEYTGFKLSFFSSDNVYQTTFFVLNPNTNKIIDVLLVEDIGNEFSYSEDFEKILDTAEPFEEIEIKFVDKKNVPQNIYNGIYNDKIQLEIDVTNNTDKVIRGIQGVVTINDLFGKKILKSNCDFTGETIEPDKTVHYSKIHDINIFDSYDTKLYNEKFEDLQFEYEITDIVYKD